MIIERKLEIEKVLSELKGHRREVRLTLKQPSLEFITIMGTEVSHENIEQAMGTVISKDIGG